MAAVRHRRRRANWLMTESCVVDRPTGESEYDPQTHESKPKFERVYAGKCRLRQQTSYGVAPTDGGHTYEIQTTECHFPWRAFDAKINDVVTVTGWRYPFRIRGLINMTHATAMRTLVDAVTD